MKWTHFHSLSKNTLAAILSAASLFTCGCVEKTITWMPDSSGFVYTDRSCSRIVHYDLAKKAKRVIVQDTKSYSPQPAVSPDGKFIAVARGDMFTVTGSKEIVEKLQLVIYDLDGQEVQRSRVWERTRRLDKATIETKSEQRSENLVWMGHPNKILCDGAIYDRAKDRWLPISGFPIAYNLSDCPPTQKGFLVANLPEDPKSDDVRLGFVDWDGWVSEFKDTVKADRNSRHIKASWNGDVWRLTTTTELHDFNVAKMTYTREKAPPAVWVESETPEWNHRFTGTDSYLCLLRRDDHGAIRSRLEIQVPSQRRRRMVLPEGEYTTIRCFSSPDGKRVAVWCESLGEKTIMVQDPKGAVTFVPRVPPLPSKNIILVFDESGDVVATVNPE